MTTEKIYSRVTVTVHIGMFTFLEVCYIYRVIVVPVTPCKWYLTFLYQRSNILTPSVYPIIFEKQCLDLYYLNELCSHPVLSTFTNKQYSQILIITVPTSKKLKH